MGVLCTRRSVEAKTVLQCAFVGTDEILDGISHKQSVDFMITKLAVEAACDGIKT